MQVRERMTHPVQCLKPLDSVRHARELMATLRINQLPVAVDGRLVGIVTDRDVRDASPSVFEAAGPRRRSLATAEAEQVTVEQIMSSSVLTLAPGDSIVQAAQLMRRERIGALPIVEDNRLVGILTRSDLLQALVEVGQGGGLSTHASRGLNQVRVL